VAKLKTEYALVVKDADGNEQILRRLTNKGEAIFARNCLNGNYGEPIARLVKRKVTDWEDVKDAD
jgi:hypothetical protein